MGTSRPPEDLGELERLEELEELEPLADASFAWNKDAERSLHSSISRSMTYAAAEQRNKCMIDTCSDVVLLLSYFWFCLVTSCCSLVGLEWLTRPNFGEM